VNPQSVVSVGNKGSERQITNVAAGQLSKDSTDAINGSQLYATNQALDDLGDQINNIDVSNNTHYYSVNDNDDKQANYDNDGATGVDALAAGPAAQSAGDSAVAVGYQAKASKREAVAVGNNAQGKGAYAVAVGSQAVGADHATAMGY